MSGKIGGRFVCHILRIYIYLIKSPPLVKRISHFQFFYILILIRQWVYKTLLFERKVFGFYFLDRKERDGFPLLDQVEDRFRGNDKKGEWE